MSTLRTCGDSLGAKERLDAFLALLEAFEPGEAKRDLRSALSPCSILGVTHVVQFHVPFVHRLGRFIPELPGVLDDILRIEIAGERERNLPRSGRLDPSHERLVVSTMPDLPVRCDSTSVFGQRPGAISLASLNLTFSSPPSTLSQCMPCSGVVTLGLTFFEASIDLVATRAVTGLSCAPTTL